MAEARRVSIDVGAGDGLAALRSARSDPTTFAVALDPSIDRLRDGARTALRQKIENVMFVVSSIEDAPCELDGLADEITVSFPWGSLLRGVVRAEPSVLVPLAGLAKVGACVRILISVSDRDGRSGLSPSDAEGIIDRSADYARAGFIVERAAIATAAEIASAGSTWAKRLGSERTVHAIRLRRLRDAAPQSPVGG